jgi:hypothetical protein
MRFTTCAAAVCAATMLPGGAAAAPLAREAVPDPLKPWVPWVLYGQETLACPPAFDDAAARSCIWPAALELEVGPTGGRFRYTVEVFAPEQIVVLPGSDENWPTDVQIDRRPAAVLTHEQTPAVMLNPGSHSITGAFVWSRMPQSLRVAPATGVVHLVRGASSTDATPDSAGRLWLAQRAEAVAVADVLTVRRLRLIEDGVPVIVHTRIELEAGGRGREVRFAGVVLPGFVATDLSSALPARLDADGSARLQARPGKWVLEVSSRSTQPVLDLALPKDAGGDEVWSFAARPEFRAVTVSGAPAVDAKQITMPDAWRRYPAYALAPGGKLLLTETRRGDANPAPDQLALKRTIWLDFDGGGYTTQDLISGSISRSWRMSAASGVGLGRVAIDGVDQLITRMQADGPSGFEVRRGAANIAAESRLEGSGSVQPASGWSSDFSSASATLMVPPGWRLLAAGGVDRAAGSWVSQWTLYDFFFVLIGTLAAARLFGWRIGVVAFAALVLSWHIEDAPRAVWFFLLVALALVRVLPAGRLGLIVQWLARAAAFAVALLWIPFAVGQIREALYPSLEFAGTIRSESFGEAESSSYPYQYPTAYARRELLGGLRRQAPRMAAPPPPAELAAKPSAAESETEEKTANAEADQMVAGAAAPATPSTGGRVPVPGRNAAPLGSLASKFASDAGLQQVAGGARIQTGGGLPRWHWRSYELVWQGPLLHDQTVRLWLVSPAVNAILNVLRVGLAGLLLVMLVRRGAVLRGPRPPAGVSGGQGPAGPGGAPAAAPVGSSPGATAEAPAGPAATATSEVSAGPVASAALAVACCATLLAAFVASGDARAQGRADVPAPATADSAPSQAILDELRDRLTAPPACMPSCADIARLALSAAGDRIQLRLEVHAASDVALPLPGQPAQWRPSEVSIDTAPATLRRDERGTLWVRTPAGVHTVTLVGSAGHMASVQLALPLRPRVVQLSLDGWQASGVDDEGRPAGAIVLTRMLKDEQAAASESTDRDALTPFVRVERTVGLGLEWNVTTRIVRLSPSLAPLVVRIPLLDGETPTSSDVKVADRVAAFSLGAAREATFSSSLAQSPKLVLKASSEANQIELWRLDAATLWHVELAGIPVVHQQSAGVWLPQWNPWPGETVSIAVTRPQGVEGPSLTLEASSLEVIPGLRSTDATLTMSLRSSQGGTHTITLPQDAELLGVRIDNAEQPAQLEGRALRLPITPTLQNIRVNWREPRGMSTGFATPVVDVGLAGVNASLTLGMPPERWLLFTGGPRLGPAVLYWGVVIVLALLAVALARSRIGPLGAVAWFLLGLGLAQSTLAAAVVPVVWFGLLAARTRFSDRLPRGLFNTLQVAIVLVTIIAASVILGAVRAGLLGTPDMQIAGNGSSAEALMWFADRHGTSLPRSWTVSIPVMAYRLLMLGWALWLAWSILRWTRWAWAAYSAGGLWRPGPPRKKKDKPQATPAGGVGSDAAVSAESAVSKPESAG